MQKNYIYPFQNLSLGFILKIFLKFRKFQPRYSYKIYSHKKKRVSKFVYYRVFYIKKADCFSHDSNKLKYTSVSPVFMVAYILILSTRQQVVGMGHYRILNLCCYKEKLFELLRDMIKLCL